MLGSAAVYTACWCSWHQIILCTYECTTSNNPQRWMWRPTGETQCSCIVGCKSIYCSTTWPFRRMFICTVIVYYVVITRVRYINACAYRRSGVGKKCVRRRKNSNKSGKGVAVVLIKFSENVAKKHRLTHTHPYIYIQ